jgi:hypothetical protein
LEIDAPSFLRTPRSPIVRVFSSAPFIRCSNSFLSAAALRDFPELGKPVNTINGIFEWLFAERLDTKSQLHTTHRARNRQTVKNMGKTGLLIIEYVDAGATGCQRACVNDLNSL